MTDTSIPRRCHVCGNFFPATPEYFHRNKGQAGGLKYACKPCSRLDSQQYKAENPDKIKQTDTAYNASHKQEMAEYNAAYYAKDPEHHRGRSAAWRRANPERHAEQENNRRARKRKATGSHTFADIELLQKGQGNRCWYCGADLTDGYHIDHFVPLSKGGTNEPGNLRLACPNCNLKKSNKDPQLWSGRLL